MKTTEMPSKGNTRDSIRSARRVLRMPLYSNALYLLAGNGIGAAFGFVFWAFAARFYPAADVGVMSAAVAALGLLGSLSHMGLGVGIIRFLPKDDKQASQLIKFSYSSAFIAAAVLSVIFLLGTGLWSPGLESFRQDAGRFIPFVLFTVFTALVAITDGVFIARRKAGFSMARGLTMNIIKFGLVLAFAATSLAYGIFLSWGAALSISLFLGVFFLLPRVVRGFFPGFSLDLRGKGEIIRYSLVTSAANLLSSLPGQVLPIMLLGRLGSEANAFFFIAWQVMAGLAMVPSSVSTSLFAEGCHDERELLDNTWRSLRLAFAILAPVIILLLLFSAPLLRVFGADYAGHSTRLLQVLSLSLVPMTINNVYFAILRVQRRLRALTILNGVIAAATFAITYPLLPYMDTLGAGIGWLAAETLVAAWIIFGQGRRGMVLQGLRLITGRRKQAQGLNESPAK